MRNSSEQKLTNQEENKKDSVFFLLISLLIKKEASALTPAQPSVAIEDFRENIACLRMTPIEQRLIAVLVPFLITFFRQ